MKKAVAWLMLLTAMTLFVFNAASVKASQGYHDLYAGSPHPYTDKWDPMQVGGVVVSNDGYHLYVRYTMWGFDWELTETHVAVATSLAGIPQTKSGNPKVGHFPYAMMHKPPVTAYTYEIDLVWTAGTELVIAAHAVVQNGCREETAWADCEGPEFQFPGNNWATYINYTVQ